MYKHRIDALNTQFMRQISNLKTSRQSMCIYKHIYYSQADGRTGGREDSALKKQSGAQIRYLCHIQCRDSQN